MIGKIELLLATHTKDFTASNQTCTLYTITISLFRNPTVGLDANRSTGYGVVCKAILVFSLAEAKQYKAQDQFNKKSCLRSPGSEIWPLPKCLWGEC